MPHITDPTDPHFDRPVPGESVVSVRLIRSLLGVSKFQAFHADANVLPGEYKLVGYNYDRRVALILAVEADSATHAIWHADRWVERAGKVRPNVWRTSPAF